MACANMAGQRCSMFWRASHTRQKQWWRRVSTKVPCRLQKLHVCKCSYLALRPPLHCAWPMLCETTLRHSLTTTMHSCQTQLPSALPTLIFAKTSFPAKEEAFAVPEHTQSDWHEQMPLCQCQKECEISPNLEETALRKQQKMERRGPLE